MFSVTGGGYESCPLLLAKGTEVCCAGAILSDNGAVVGWPRVFGILEGCLLSPLPTAQVPIQPAPWACSQAGGAPQPSPGIWGQGSTAWCQLEKLGYIIQEF